MRSNQIRRRLTRHGYTLLEVFLVLIITGVLLAAIGSALHIHLRVAEVGRTEVEQAQLARALLRRMADDLRGAVPHIEPVASTAGATSDSIAAAAASAATALGGTGATGSSAGGGTSSGGTSGASASASSKTASSGSSSSGGGTSSGGSSGTQTLQPLGKLGTLGTLSALKPQSSASSASSGASGSSSSGSAGGSTGSSTGSSGSKSSSGTDAASDTSEETSTAKPPGIYGDQYTLQIDVSRLPRAGAAVATSLDAPGDVKTVGYYLAPITGATDATGSPSMGLYRQSFDKAVANYGATVGGAATTEPQLLAAEVAAIEFQYYDGTTWQSTWDSSSSGALPAAVEILLTLHPSQAATTVNSQTLAQPQVYRLTVAIPAAPAAGSSTSTSTETESDSSAASSSSSGATK